MAEVDPNNKDIKSFSVRHHRFDPETNHFRWFTVKCFDNQKDMSALLEVLWRELERRKAEGEAHSKEQFAGSIYNPKRAKKHPSSSEYIEVKRSPVYNFRRVSYFLAFLRDAKFKFKKF